MSKTDRLWWLPWWSPYIMGLIYSRNLYKNGADVLHNTSRRMHIRRSSTRNKRREDGNNWISSSHSSRQEELQEGEEGELSTQQEEGQETKEDQERSFLPMFNAILVMKRDILQDTVPWRKRDTMLMLPNGMKFKKKFQKREGWFRWRECANLSTYWHYFTQKQWLACG